MKYKRTSLKFYPRKKEPYAKGTFNQKQSSPLIVWIEEHVNRPRIAYEEVWLFREDIWLLKETLKGLTPDNCSEWFPPRVDDPANPKYYSAGYWKFVRRLNKWCQRLLNTYDWENYFLVVDAVWLEVETSDF